MTSNANDVTLHTSWPTIVNLRETEFNYAVHKQLADQLSLVPAQLRMCMRVRVRERVCVCDDALIFTKT